MCSKKEPYWVMKETGEVVRVKDIKDTHVLCDTYTQTNILIPKDLLIPLSSCTCKGCKPPAGSASVDTECGG